MTLRRLCFCFFFSSPLKCVKLTKKCCGEQVIHVSLMMCIVMLIQTYSTRYPASRWDSRGCRGLYVSPFAADCRTRLGPLPSQYTDYRRGWWSPDSSASSWWRKPSLGQPGPRSRSTFASFAYGRLPRAWWAGCLKYLVRTFCVRNKRNLYFFT